MPNKSTKSRKTQKSQKTQNCGTQSTFRHPSTWLIAILSIALIAVCCVAAYGFKKLGPDFDLNSAKLAVFDNLASDYLQRQEINSEKPSVKKITGYGVSDEDGAFYITFDYTTYNLDNPSNPIPDEPKHAIMYFWKDNERNTYSHAFSYHDDDYHPGGTYVKVESE